VSEDEFEFNARQEARQYSEMQRNQSVRAQIKAQNRLRKQQGLEALKLPSPIQQRAAHRHVASDSDDDSSDLGANGDSDSWISEKGKRKRSKRQEDTLIYEGRKCRF
jgi:hypothetical protein